MNPKELCLNLAYANTEDDVVNLLTMEGYWDDLSTWRYYGDNENNYATIGNQQNRPEVALVEKIINSVDAVLMSECLSRGIIPESKQAPQSFIEALETYFNISNGKLSNLSPSQRKIIAERISLVATGEKTNPSYSIIILVKASHHNMPNTILSNGNLIN